MAHLAVKVIKRTMILPHGLTEPKIVEEKFMY